MFIQKCLNCREKFKYKQLLWSGLSGYKSVKCERCGEVHGVTFSSRLRIAFIVVLPLIVGFYLYEELSGFERVVMYLILVLLMMLFSPFLLNYSNFKKPK